MLSYLIRRLILRALFTFLAISMLSFAIIQLPPGDYVDAYIAQMSASGSAVSAAGGPEPAQPVRARSADVRPVPELDEPGRARQLRHGDGVGPPGHRGDRRPALADDGRLDRRCRPDLALALPIGIYSAVRQYSLGDYMFTFSGSSGWPCRASCSRCWSSTSASVSSMPTSAACSRPSTSTRPGAGQSSATCSNICRSRR